MTGSGKTGLGIALIEEAAIDGLPVLAIDPKGDLSNLALRFPNLSAGRVRAVGEPRRGPRPAAHAGGLRRGRSGPLGGRAGRLGTGRRPHRPAGRGRRRHHLHAGQPRRAAAVDPRDVQPAAAGHPRRARAAGRSACSRWPRACCRWPASRPTPTTSREHVLVATLLQEAWRAGRDARPRVAHRPGAVAAAGQGRACSTWSRSSPPPIASRWRCGSTTCWRRRASRRGSRARRSTSAGCSSRRRQAAGRGRLDCPSRRHRAHVLRRAAARAGAGVGARPARHDVAARGALHGRAVRLPAADGEPAEQGAAAHAAQAGARLRPRAACWRRRTRSTSTTRRCPTPARGSSAGCRPSATRPACSTGSRAWPRAPARASTASALDRLLSSLDKRVFLLHNVHDREPLLFQTRWAMSYLRGPMGRDEIRALMDPVRRRRPRRRPPAGARGALRRSRPQSRPRQLAAVTGTAGARGRSCRPTCRSTSHRAPARRGCRCWSGPPASPTATPSSARRHQRHRDVDAAHRGPGAGRLGARRAGRLRRDALTRDPAGGGAFAALPAPAAKPKNYPAWTKAFVAWAGALAEAWSCCARRAPGSRRTPASREGDFRVRVQHALREKRDAALAALRAKQGAKLAALEEKIRRAGQQVAEGIAAGRRNRRCPPRCRSAPRCSARCSAARRSAPARWAGRRRRRAASAGWAARPRTWPGRRRRSRR